LFIWIISFSIISYISMSLNKRQGPLNQQEVQEHRELRKQLRERIKQLRLAEYLDDDEEPDVYIYKDNA
jgi:hypothetical protein